MSTTACIGHIVSAEWESGFNALLMAEWRQQKGEGLVLMVKQYAEAIYALTIEQDGKTERKLAMLAEAMQYCSYGGMDGFMADLERSESISDSPPCQGIRVRIANISRFLQGLKVAG
jgi:hypothetical protein